MKMSGKLHGKWRSESRAKSKPGHGSEKPAYSFTPGRIPYIVRHIFEFLKIASKKYVEFVEELIYHLKGGIGLKIRFLGTGAAEGIPSFGCTCPRCTLAREKKGPNVRGRSSLLIEAEDQRILVDTPPEISLQMNQADIFDLTAILLSHEHFDHIGGLTEFEYWNQVLPIFTGYDVLPKLRLTPRLKSRALLSDFHSHSRLHFGGLTVMPFKVIHHVPCYGFEFEAGGARIVHFADSDSALSNLHRHLAQEADAVIFHTPTFDAKRHHLCVQDVLALVQDWSLKHAVITHINHNNINHEELMARVSSMGVTVAYDSLILEI